MSRAEVIAVCAVVGAAVALVSLVVWDIADDYLHWADGDEDLLDGESLIEVQD